MVIAVGAKDQSEMLEICGFSSSAAGNWKSRKKVPEKSLRLVASQGNVSKEWLESGKGEMREQPEPEITRDGYALDEDLMTMIFTVIEEVLTKTGRTLSHAEKAKLTTAVYRETADQVQSRDDVTRIVRAAVNFVR